MRGIQTWRPGIWVGILIAALGVSACGGGSGGSDDTPADASLVSGSYFLCIYGGDDGTPDAGNVIWGVSSADGAGMLASTVGINDGGVLGGPVAAPATYTVAGDRATTVVLGGSTGYAGWTDAAGSAVMTSAVANGSTPATLTLLKLGSGYVDADMQGDWFVAVYDVTLAGSAQTLWGPVTLDAMGDGTVSLTGNAEGTVNPSGTTGMDASVAGNGQVALTFGGATFEGSLHAGKNLAIFTGSTTSGEDPVWVVMVRKAAGASAATFSGSYQIVGLERDGSGFASITGSAVADGMGSVTVNFTKNTDGTISVDGPIIVSYTVAGDGSVEVDPTGEPVPGSVASDGAFAVLCGPNAAAAPRMYVLMRR